MKITIFTAIVATFSFSLSPISTAQTYQTEIGVTYSEFDSDFYPGDNYSIGLQGTQYFSPVYTRNLPLAEAAFLQKASSLSLSLANDDYEFDDQDGDSYLRGANVTYYIPNSIFFVGAGITENKLVFTHRYYGDYAYEGIVSTDWRSHWNATLGVAPIDGLQVWSEFLEGVDVSDYWNLSAKYVKPLVGEQAISIEARYVDDRQFDIRSVVVSTDYYFNHRFSVGLVTAQFIFGSSEVDDSTPYHIRARQFITENTSVELAYFSSDYSDRWQLGGTIRF